MLREQIKVENATTLAPSKRQQALDEHRQSGQSAVHSPSTATSSTLGTSSPIPPSRSSELASSSARASFKLNATQFHALSGDFNELSSFITQNHLDQHHPTRSRAINSLQASLLDHLELSNPVFPFPQTTAWAAAASLSLASFARAIAIFCSISGCMQLHTQGALVSDPLRIGSIAHPPLAHQPPCSDSTLYDHLKQPAPTSYKMHTTDHLE
ncbi:hypothetical protein PGT21_018309 [Puccinia graminis f. sp. tritici]|uniref:Uncharacterized protein n=1 Tax=Puccinia graminis f. sp. tritici TaxID=56615 RepID=A0A5B0QBJ4_PUCGR|nr:hypothetical protein PGT21_018309 [Puccinia graminis f. sp. tritici]